MMSVNIVNINYNGVNSINSINIRYPFLIRGQHDFTLNNRRSDGLNFNPNGRFRRGYIQAPKKSDEL